MIELHLLKDGEVMFIHRVRPEGSQVGRVAGNDLVIGDRKVSQHHAVVWIEDGRAFIKDLGSRNGTFVNDVRIDTRVELTTGDTVGIGPDAVLVVREAEESWEEAAGLVVEQVGTRVCIPVTGDRFRIGPELSDDLRVPDAPERLGTLLVYDDGEVYLGTGEEEHQIQLDEPFELGGQRFVVRRDDALQGPTAVAVDERYPYRVTATLNGPTGPEALLEDLSSARQHRIMAENRAILLYLLARQHARDVEESMPARERGWCADTEVQVGIWGRDGAQENKLHVLVHRLRAEVKAAGFDPWFIEMRRRYIRARLVEAEVS